MFLLLNDGVFYIACFASLLNGMQHFRPLKLEMSEQLTLKHFWMLFHKDLSCLSMPCDEMMILKLKSIMEMKIPDLILKSILFDWKVQT